LTMDYGSWIDKDVINAYTDNKSGSDEMGRLIVAGMKADRKAMFGGQMLRAMGFAAVVIGLLYMYMRNIIKPVVVAISLALISTFELLMIDKDYLNKDSFMDPGSLSSENFTPTEHDKQILQDKDRDFRVFDLSSGNPYTESRTSYFHKSIGGYHPAKLRIYQDIIDRYLSRPPFNQNVLNMLNMKYKIVGDQTNQTALLDTNHNALCSCWLLKHVTIVNNNVQELQSIGNADLKDTAFVQNSFANAVVQPQWDSTASIKLAKFDNDTIQYSFTANAPQFAVFSEVYYPYGWNAYIDGKKAA